MTQGRKDGVVDVGCWVSLAGFEPGEEETVEIVDDMSARPAELKVARSSPLAQALIGRQVGDEVVYQTPGGEVNLTVVEIGPA